MLTEKENCLHASARDQAVACWSIWPATGSLSSARKLLPSRLLVRRYVSAFACFCVCERIRVSVSYAQGMEVPGRVVASLGDLHHRASDVEVGSRVRQRSVAVHLHIDCGREIHVCMYVCVCMSVYVCMSTIFWVLLIHAQLKAGEGEVMRR